MFKKISLLAIFVTSAIILNGCSKNNNSLPTTNKKPIVLGYIGPLSGDAAPYGEDEKRAIILALEKIQKDKLIDREIKIIYEDGRCNGKDAATAAQKLVNVDKVKIILGGACSGETIAAAPITEANKILLFSSFSSNPAISTIGDYVFRNTPSDKGMADGLAETIYADGFRRVAIISENTDYARGMRDNFLQRFKILGGDIISDETYNQEAKDFRTELTKIKKYNPEVLVINSQSGAPAGLIAKQAKNLGLTAVLYGNNTFGSGDAQKAAGAVLNNTKFVDAPGFITSNLKANDFRNEYLKRFPQPASEWGVATKYDSVLIIINAIQYCQDDQDTGCLKKYLYQMEDFEGISGNYHFDLNGDPVGQKAYSIKKIINAEEGKVEEIT